MTIIWPVARVKLFVEHVFDKLVEMIWQELSGGDKAYSQAANAIAALIFSILCIAVYHIEEYENVMLLVLLALWQIDRVLAKHEYAKGQKEQIDLTVDADGQYHWKRKCALRFSLRQRNP